MNRKAPAIYCQGILFTTTLTALAMLALPASAQTTPPPGVETTAKADAETTVAATDEAPDQTDQADESPTFKAEAGARPTLDYEPSETISEDTAVSFPVDI